MRLLIGTDDGLHELEEGAPRRLAGGRVTHLAVGQGRAWAIVDDVIQRLDPESPANLRLPNDRKPRCLLPLGDGLLIGTAMAQLYRADGGDSAAIQGFEHAPGRERWHTPWGGPPDTRSLARDADETLYANVHVGGVLRSSDGEDWQPTMDIAADVHQVHAHPTLEGCVLVAAAWGLGYSFDGGETWEFTRDGLHNSYARAVAVAHETVLISASDGPRGGRAAVYRRRLRSTGPLERCRVGLPDWFAGNIDSGCLVASGPQVAFGTADGVLYVSSDSGATWTEAASGLPPVRAVGALI